MACQSFGLTLPATIQRICGDSHLTTQHYSAKNDTFQSINFKFIGNELSFRFYGIL